jgi:thymidine kinase
MSSFSSFPNKTGYLEMVIGPMFSGKTTWLIEKYKSYTYIGKKVLVINYSADIRYSTTMLSSHDRIEIPCVFSSLICDDSDVWNAVKDADVILINEGQFFSDLIGSVRMMVDTMNKHVFISGLDGDFRREKFGDILDLIPICDKVEKLSALCAICRNGTPAIFSKRLTDESNQVVIGSDNYKPLCRNCYLSV